MNSKNSLFLRLELMWWAFTVLVLAGVLYPIYNAHPQPDYPFWLSNVIFILVFITLTRSIFLLKHTWLGYRQKAKVIALVLCIPLFFYLFDAFQHFRGYSDDFGMESHFQHLSLAGQESMANYIKNEMIFFGTGSFIVTCMLPFRMLISYWRTRNRGTV